MKEKSRIVSLNSSYRRKGNTNRMVEEVLKGCREAGTKTDHIFLMEKDIKACLGCLKFSKYNEETFGRCVQKDDMRGLLKKVVFADGLIVACLVYCGNMNAHMVKFMHRMSPLAYDKSLDGGMVGIPVYKLKPTKPGMYITSMIAPFPLNRVMGVYRNFYKMLRLVLRLAGFKADYVLNVGGSEEKTSIPNREEMKSKAFKLCMKLAGH
ncbi:MAG: flavodoxin family protein [Deltaproteobacteria bacterium]|uniref:Flavodoxin family protein n=1 Tax=Candidatus Zymogenus saltonus TaxID=2844893 RepID=A0A9D8KDL9_9DELT|nr:flavodoxin family protein [Candidatus Zymogenus saltonus]